MPSQIAISSEIGRLRTVIVHEPGAEIENMTPAMATEALYDDLLFLAPAQYEHRQLAAVLGKVARVLSLTPLLEDVLADAAARRQLVVALCQLHGCPELTGQLVGMEAGPLARQLITGTPMRKDSLAKFLSPLPFALPPLPNAFFMRDAAMCIHDKVVVSAMASRVRASEATILRSLFRHHPALGGAGLYLDGQQAGPQGDPGDLSIEGGDVLVLREDLILIGMSARTTVAAVDQLLKAMAPRGLVRDVVVVELPTSRALIHLDMAFTMLDAGHCLVYPPLMTGPRRSPAIHVSMGPSGVQRIQQRPGLLEALRELGLDLEPIPAGGMDPITQEREQWSSGANAFALAPGVIIGYERNRATFEALDRAGYRVVGAEEFAATTADVDELTGPVAITMEGEELNRGGGGCRCMTLPVRRDPV
jgi:arginine deiminase